SEGGVGTAGVGLCVDGADREVRSLEGAGQGPGRLLVERQDAVGDVAGGVEVTARGDAGAVDGDQGGVEGGGVAVLGEPADEVPIGGGGEGHPLAFALHDDADRHGLHSTGRQTGGDLFPQDGRHLVSVETVEDAASLLG